MSFGCVHPRSRAFSHRLVLIVNQFNDDGWFTFMLLSLLLGIELVVLLFYLAARAVTQVKLARISEQGRKIQASRALILGFSVIIVLVVIAVATGLSKNQYVMVGFGLLAMPFIGAMLISNMKNSAQAVIIALAAAAAWETEGVWDAAITRRSLPRFPPFIPAPRPPRLQAGQRRPVSILRRQAASTCAGQSAERIAFGDP